ncbi:MAG: hypothetical protein IPP30_09170 [Flavobacterium sp.]|nr:hypothetical protein [Flavobacterium sp.]
MIMKNQRYIIVLSIVAFLLFIPFLAMQMTTEVNWSLFDFMVMGALLLGTGFLCEFVLRKVTTVKYRILLCLSILTLFLLIWAELAVGVFGSPIAGS